MEGNRIPATGAEEGAGPRIIGSYIQAFMICPRQAWLASRQICPDEDNVHLQIGRLIQSQSYTRERKEIHLEHLAIDLVRRGGKNLVVAEIKKSSRAAAAARMQLAFYLYELKRMGLEAEGELLFPEERKREPVVLDPALEAEVETLKRKIWAIILRPQPPQPARIKFCSKCAYSDFCWA
ncbi:MAG: CRISPR-associated protein Cas4 [Bacillota bacterium]